MVRKMNKKQQRLHDRLESKIITMQIPVLADAVLSVYRKRGRYV
jgi:hypothetical protein